VVLMLLYIQETTEISSVLHTILIQYQPRTQTCSSQFPELGNQSHLLCSWNKLNCYGWMHMNGFRVLGLFKDVCGTR
jgi:hypothetical protein